MATQMKTFDCKYCNITAIPRNEYKKHIRTPQHKNMLEYSRHCTKIRTQTMVNAKVSSTKVKFTKDGKYVNDYVKKMIEETKKE
jgi:ribosomal protein S30